MFKTWIIFILGSFSLLYDANAIELNVALNQTVTTSSIAANHPASMATDQKLSTYVQVDYVEGVPAWILFDLKYYTYYVSKVIIWPTNDTDFELAKVAVYASYFNSLLENADDYIGTYDNPVMGVPFYFSRNISRIIGYVLFIKDSYFRTETLKISEIAIIITESSSYFKKWKTPQQSNGISGAGINGPENAIDDDASTCIYTDQTDVSKQNIRGWWHVDLGKAYDVFGFVIFDKATKNQSYRGNYKLYVDTDGFIKSNLCAFDNQTVSENPKFTYCVYILTGRYITVEREQLSADANRQDLLSFCHLRLAIDTDEVKVYTNPQNYIYKYSSPDIVQDIKPTAQYLVEKIIIGVVTGVGVFIVSGLLFGIICYFVGKKSKNKRIAERVNETTANVSKTAERLNETTADVANNHYSEIDEFAMQPRNLYDKTI